MQEIRYRIDTKNRTPVEFGSGLVPALLDLNSLTWTNSVTLTYMSSFMRCKNYENKRKSQKVGSQTLGQWETWRTKVNNGNKLLPMSCIV